MKIALSGTRDRKEMSKQALRRILGERGIRRLREVRHYVGVAANWPRCAINRARMSTLLRDRPRLHLGCGARRIGDFINVDNRPTRAVDIVMDCSDVSPFGESSVDLVYSHAFFEHLFWNQREACLRSCRFVLKNGGNLVFTGIPDFEQLARAYLEGEPGITTRRFDLSQVYRYTHGNPEGAAGWWLGQLHKTLFDVETVEDLLASGGFQSWAIMNYRFRDEPIALNFALVARKSRAVTADEAIALVTRLNSDVAVSSIDLRSVQPPPRRHGQTPRPRSESR